MMFERRRWAWCALVGLGACGGRVEQGPGGAAQTVATNLEPSQDGCEALLSALQADLGLRARVVADRARVQPTWFTPDTEPSEPLFGSLWNDRSPAPSLPEGDVIAADGGWVYAIDHRAEVPSLVVAATRPEGALTLQGRVAVEGTPVELAGSSGRVVVFSLVTSEALGFGDGHPGFTKLSVFDIATSPPALLREIYVEGEYAFVRREGTLVRAIVEHRPRVQLDRPIVTVRDFLGRARPPAQIDDLVNVWLRITDDTIASTALGDYLPTVYERQDGVLVPQAPRCDDAYVLQPGRGEPGAVSVLSLDLEALGDPAAAEPASLDAAMGQLLVFGDAMGVTLEPGSALVYRAHQTPSLPGVEDPPSPPVRSRDETDLNLFDLHGLEARHAASGTVAGHLGASDRLDSVLRVITNDSVYVRGDSGDERFAGQEVTALTLAIDAGRLVELGRSPIAGVNSSVSSAVFSGDRLFFYGDFIPGPWDPYARTQLIAFDVSDATAPRETGRLAVPTQNSGLIAVPGQRLLSLAFGPDVYAYPQYLDLQLFDVSDPAAPRLADSYAYPLSSGASNSGDPRVVAFDAERTRFTLPVYAPGSSWYSVYSLDVFELVEGGLSRMGSVVPAAAELSLVECAALQGLPTDDEAIAALQANPSELQSLLDTCAVRSRSNVERGLLLGDHALMLSLPLTTLSYRVSTHSFDDLAGPPSSQLDL